MRESVFENPGKCHVTRQESVGENLKASNGGIL